MSTPQPHDLHDAPGPSSRFALPSTGWLAFVGFTIFVSGIFLLAAAGRGLPMSALAIVLGGAVLVALPLLALCIAVAWSEAMVRRAWASGFRRLSIEECGRTVMMWRGLRYAGVLWLANGGALWYAALASGM